MSNTNERSCMKVVAKSGYDAPRVAQAEDDLDRWRFAAELVELVKNTPLDWSIRIGVFGKWGEGKSTVLHFIEHMVREDGHLVVWFVPWAATNWDQLWAEFANRLLDVVEGSGIKVDGMRTVKAEL
jgi:predicted KAP-like P-loop ATPase